MPKTEIDYSNTIFYKIYCKNPDIKDVYIGHTTNFVQRKHAHKRSCTHETSANYNCKVYNVIREYGGWNNWKMEIIAFRECADHYEARKVEQQYFEEYNATLNSIEPFPKPKAIVPKPIRVKIEKKLLYCETCNVYFHTKNANDVHVKTNKHIKRVAKANKPAQVSIKIPENAKKFTCEKCEFDCKKLCDYKRHLETAKHNFLNSNNSSIRRPSTYKCICGNEYKHAPSLCKHKHTCTYNYAQNKPNDAVKFECIKCNFTCSKQSNYNAHLSTTKHKRMINNTIMLPQILTCDCGNEYQYRSGLSRHKKICTYNSTPPLENTIIYTQDKPTQPTADNATELATDKLFVLVKELMLQLAVKDKQHQELMSLMVTRDQQIAEFQNTMNEMISHLDNKKIYKKVLPEIKLDKSVI
jgi:hypothetical protein